jgi:hypothetical protein
MRVLEAASCAGDAAEQIPDPRGNVLAEMSSRKCPRGNLVPGAAVLTARPQDSSWRNEVGWKNAGRISSSADDLKDKYTKS